MINFNEYFDGKVKSLANELNDKKFSVGIIEAGEYTFGTGEKEYMEVVHGEMQVIMPDNPSKMYKKGEIFNVPENSEFTVLVKAPVSYLCIYG